MKIKILRDLYVRDGVALLQKGEVATVLTAPEAAEASASDVVTLEVAEALMAVGLKYVARRAEDDSPLVEGAEPIAVHPGDYEVIDA